MEPPVLTETNRHTIKKCPPNAIRDLGFLEVDHWTCLDVYRPVSCGRSGEKGDNGGWGWGSSGVFHHKKGRH